MAASVHNDFHRQHAIFPIFNGLEVKDMEETVFRNGHAETNGIPKEQNSIHHKFDRLELNGNGTHSLNN